MIYIKSVVAGIVTSIAALVLFAVIMNAAYRNRGGTGMVVVNIFAPLPVAVMILGFATGFVLVFRISK
jgi:F0F1-type ATP synthase membrane subunit c/vacuolar-type H+-ATPase subunit K